jgi:hypothetical protein
MTSKDVAARIPMKKTIIEVCDHSIWFEVVWG